MKQNGHTNDGSGREFSEKKAAYGKTKSGKGLKNKHSDKRRVIVSNSGEMKPQ